MSLLLKPITDVELANLLEDSGHTGDGVTPLPCPFCATVPEVTINGGRYELSHGRALGYDCPLQRHGFKVVGSSNSKSGLVEAWNRRAWGDTGRRVVASLSTEREARRMLEKAKLQIEDDARRQRDELVTAFADRSARHATVIGELEARVLSLENGGAPTGNLLEQHKQAQEAAHHWEKRYEQARIETDKLQAKVTYLRQCLLRFPLWLRRFSKFTARLADMVDKEMPK